MNCCQPWQAVGFAAPLQAGTLLWSFVKKFVLSWSEKTLGTFGTGAEQFGPNVVPVSLVTPVTLWKDPSAEDTVPDGFAAKSLPLPTISGRGPLAGGCGLGGGVVHGISCHSLLGNVDLKHPCFGRGTRDMVARHPALRPPRPIAVCSR
jgi:hypothetical protein